MRLQLNIHGAVQGVGFRPFVYRLATDMALTGYVINHTQGVCIELEGPQPTLERFIQRLTAEKPPLALIHALDTHWLAPVGYTSFTIRHSDERGTTSALVLPDIATCNACLHDIFNPDNRRYRYPFTTCTNCGPRFSIIQALPYDRPNTTMRHFPMCANCQSEYDDPLDRRFHAQPNACAVCGPALETLRATSLPSNTEEHGVGDDALVATAKALAAGAIVAIKGLGGFHLMVDARHTEAIARLRQRKPRPDKPFALMARDLPQAHTLCAISPEAEALLTAHEAPIVLLPKKPDASIAPNIAPGLAHLGVMLPYTPLHHLLLHAIDFPVMATSGNLSDEPICTDAHEATQRLGHIADLFLIHNRPIARHVDDSIAWIVRGEARLLRRARGYAPLPVLVSGQLPTILAVGAHLKNTVALSIAALQVTTPDKAYTHVFISQHIGDLETIEAMTAFERVIADFLTLYQATPVAIAHDMHPDYRSTRWAAEHAAEAMLIPVQHHHAHLAACLAEHNLHTTTALGVTWDGTGYGTDGTIWGGEFLFGNAASFTRIAHLRPFCLPGGEMAIQEPRRIALALLWDMYGETILQREDLALLQSFSATERTLLARMLHRNINAPTTTSAGRLFDGIAALIGLYPYTTFEGQAAIALEQVADTTVQDAYPLGYYRVEQTDENMHDTGVATVIDWRPLVEAVLHDLQQNVSQAIMAARFHNSLVETIVYIAKMVGEPHVALTGGCFQNRLLTERAAQRLDNAGFHVLLHRQVPPNDGGISLGQVVVAAANLAQGVG